MTGPLAAAAAAADPTITLAGEAFPIPELAIRQTRIILPLALALAQAGIADDGKTITTEAFDILLRIVHTAVSKARPAFTYDQLLDMRITPAELLSAVPVIARQAGLKLSLAPAPAVAGDEPGEPQGPSTGTG